MILKLKQDHNLPRLRLLIIPSLQVVAGLPSTFCYLPVFHQIHSAICFELTLFYFLASDKPVEIVVSSEVSKQAMEAQEGDQLAHVLSPQHPRVEGCCDHTCFPLATSPFYIFAT